MKAAAPAPFGKYLLLNRLAVGGMAEVFLARPNTTEGNGRIMVIKRILPHIADDPTFVSMFKSEIQTSMGFNHPHTVLLHDFGEEEQQPYLVMEYVEGKDLKQIATKLQAKGKTIPIPMAISIITQAAAGLNYAHRFENKVTGEVQHTIHRDITPHNLILSYDGNLKIIDFGIAKVKNRLAERTQSGILKGKAAYIAPEQIMGDEPDARTDIFSLGIVLWELLTLKRPFTLPGDTDYNVLARIQRCEKYLVPPSTYNSAVSPALDAVVMKAMRKNPDERYATAAEFQLALRQVLVAIYPNYSYAEAGDFLRELFREELTSERSRLREINLHAQKMLLAAEQRLAHETTAQIPLSPATGAMAKPRSRNWEEELFTDMNREEVSTEFKNPVVVPRAPASTRFLPLQPPVFDHGANPAEYISISLDRTLGDQGRFKFLLCVYLLAFFATRICG